MKKILAATLAVTMAASMTSMAFATTVNATGIKIDENSRIYTEKDGVLVEVGGELRTKPGQSIYVEILPENDGEEIPASLPGKYKVAAEWSHGKEFVDSTSIETRKTTKSTYRFDGETAPHALDNSYATEQAAKDAIGRVKIHDDTKGDTLETCTDLEGHARVLTAAEAKAVLAQYKLETSNSYRSVAAIKTKGGYSTKLEDLIGNVKVIKKSSSNSTSAPSMKLTAVVGYAQTNASDMAEITNDAPVVDFEGVDGEIELLFGDAASFTVNGKGQSNLFLGYSLKPNSDVIDQNPTANIDFVTFSAAPSFNRIGTFRLFADADSYVYEVTSKGLKAVSAKYDEAYEAYTISTRTLGSYVISDKELKYTVSADGSKPETNPGGSTEGSKPENPDTGVSMLFPTLLALAGVSATAMAVTKKRG